MFEFKAFEVFKIQEFRLNGMTDFKNENNAEIGHYGQTLIKNYKTSSSKVAFV